MKLDLSLSLGSSALRGGWSPLSAGGVRASLDLDFANNRAWNGSSEVAISSLLTCTRASTKYVETTSGLLVPFANNVLPYTNKGVLPEEPRTNLCLQSEVADSASWAKSGVTVTPNTDVAPDGTTTVDTVSGFAGGLQTINQSFAVVTAATYAFSIWLAGTGTIHLDAGGGSGGLSINLTPTLTRYQVALTEASAGTSMSARVMSLGGDTATSVKMWGAQFELGAFATSYIPTTTVSVTRASDVVSAALGAWYNAAEGTAYADLDMTAYPPGNAQQVHAFGSSAGNFWGVYYQGQFGTNVQQQSNGGTVGSLGSLAGGTNRYKIAGTYIGTVGSGVKTGGSVAAATLAAPSPAYTTLRIGCDLNAVAQGNNYIRRFAYFPVKKSNAEIAALVVL